MPVIVVGADTDIGRAVVERMAGPHREVRAFISDPEQVAPLRRLNVKVALGDVTDDSHVGAAAANCFSAVLIAEAATDERERSFATTTDEVLASWARAVREAGVIRTIWVIKDEPPPTLTGEVAVVSPHAADVVDRVVALDDAQTG